MEWNRNEYKNMMLILFSIVCILIELDYFMIRVFFFIVGLFEG